MTKTAKAFESTAAQGEIFISKISALPKGLKKVTAIGGAYIIGHSETGHHHVIPDHEGLEVMERPETGDGMKMLYAIVKEPTALKHERNYDTHKAMPLQPGVYEFRLGREQDPYKEMARRQMD